MYSNNNNNKPPRPWLVTLSHKLSLTQTLNQLFLPLYPSKCVVETITYKRENDDDDDYQYKD